MAFSILFRIPTARCRKIRENHLQKRKYFLPFIRTHNFKILLYFFSLGGKTKNYPLFLKRKKLLVKRLHMIHPTIINIQNFTKHQVPKKMINVESYK